MDEDFIPTAIKGLYVMGQLPVEAKLSTNHPTCLAALELARVAEVSSAGLILLL